MRVAAAFLLLFCTDAKETPAVSVRDGKIAAQIFLQFLVRSKTGRCFVVYYYEKV